MKSALVLVGQFFLKMMLKEHVWMGVQKFFRGGNLPWMDIKRIGDLNWGQMTQNWAQNFFFCYFLKYGSLIFLETAYNNSLQRCIRCGRGKIMKKKILDPNLGQRCQNWAPNFVFLSFLSLYFMLFYLKWNDKLWWNF